MTRARVGLADQKSSGMRRMVCKSARLARNVIDSHFYARFLADEEQVFLSLGASRLHSTMAKMKHVDSLVTSQ